MSKLVFLDTETTSLDDTRGEVWEIGAIERIPGQPDVEYWWQIRADLSTADPMSLKINGYYDRCRLVNHSVGSGVKLATTEIPARFENTEYPEPRRTEGAPVEWMGADRIAGTLARLLDGAHIVGAVPDFDFRHLRKFLTRHGQIWMGHYHLIDIETLAVGFLRGQGISMWPLPWKTTDLYKSVGVDITVHEEHTALGDARMVRDVFDAINKGGVA